MKRIDLAWAAGFIDGEGTFQVTRKHGNGKSGNSTTYLRPSVVVANTNRDALIRLCKIFPGGWLSGGVAKKDHWKPQYRAVWQYKWALALAKQVVPFLVVKKQQAEVMTLFPSGRSGLPKWRQVQWECRRKIMCLNRRGLST